MNPMAGTPERSKARYERALQLRETGLTLREVGADAGVSRERARQMIKRAEKYRRWLAENEDEGLSVRASNCLGNAGIARAPDVVAAYTTAQLLRIPNLGRKSIAEIERWLERHGLQLAE